MPNMTFEKAAKKAGDLATSKLRQEMNPTLEANPTLSSIDIPKAQVIAPEKKEKRKRKLKSLADLPSLADESKSVLK